MALKITYLTRKEWGADEALPRLGHTVQGDERTEVYIHHTVGVDNDATPNVWETMHEVTTWMRRLQTIRPDLGLDVPYSFVAFFMPGELVICEGRGAMRSGAHTIGHNRSAIGLAVHGNFQLPTFGLEAYVKAMGVWLHRLKVNQLPFLGSTAPPGRDVFGHRDSGASTNCPGDHLYARLSDLRIEEEDDVDENTKVDWIGDGRKRTLAEMFGHQMRRIDARQEEIAALKAKIAGHDAAAGDGAHKHNEED